MEELKGLENIILSLFEHRIDVLDDIIHTQDENNGYLDIENYARYAELCSMQHKIIDTIINYHTNLENRY